MTNLKDVMDEKHKQISASIRNMKAQVKKLMKAEDYSTVSYLKRKINDFDARKDFYISSKYEPVRFENGLVVNAKLVKAYLKKVPKKADVSAELNTDTLTIHFNVFAGSMGRLHLKDLSAHYEGFELPKGEELFDGIRFAKTTTEVHQR